jgi:hypothetical protein
MYRIEYKGNKAKYSLPKNKSRCGTHENKALYAKSTADNNQDQAAESTRQCYSWDNVHAWGMSVSLENVRRCLFNSEDGSSALLTDGYCYARRYEVSSPTVRPQNPEYAESCTYHKGSYGEVQGPRRQALLVDESSSDKPQVGIWYSKLFAWYLFDGRVDFVRDSRDQSSGE